MRDNKAREVRYVVIVLYIFSSLVVMIIRSLLESCWVNATASNWNRGSFMTKLNTDVEFLVVLYYRPERVWTGPVP